MSEDDFYDLPLRDAVTKDGRSIKDWLHVQTDSDTRIYFSLMERTRSGFDFCCVEWVGDDGGGGRIPNPATIDSTTCRVRKLFEGVAYFDGIRHLYFVGEGDGYIYYANLQQIVKALTALRTLEMEHCWDAPEGIKAGAKSP